jgi:hypothetical protein
MAATGYVFEMIVCSFASPPVMGFSSWSDPLRLLTRLATRGLSDGSRSTNGQRVTRVQNHDAHS